MKIIKIIFFIAAFGFVTVSCNKSQDLIYKDDVAIDKAAINQILNTSDQLTQMSMFRLLNPSEKSEIWVQKFTGYLQENKLSGEQKFFVEKMKNLSTPKLFNDINYKESINEPELKATAIKLFGVAEAFILLSSLERSSSPVSNVVAPGPNCSCSKKSDWCGTYTYCLSAICEETASGCGTFWTYSCTGRCQTGVGG